MRGQSCTDRFHGRPYWFFSPGKLLDWTEESKVPLRLRAPRKIAEDTKNHDLERDLYIEERKAERGVVLHQLHEELKEALKKGQIIELPRLIGPLVVQVLWIAVIFFYWALSNYGRSLIQPALWLYLSVLFFRWRYAEILAPLMREAGPLNADKYKHAVNMLALANGLPFIGSLTIDAEIKKFLFCPGFGPCLPLPPRGL